MKNIIIANSKENVKIGKNAFDNIEAVRFIGESNKEKKYSPILEETKDENLDKTEQERLKAEQEEVSPKEDTKQVEKNINYIYPILKPLKDFSNKPIDLYSVQKAKIKAIKRGEKIENISLFDMFGKLQEKVKV